MHNNSGKFITSTALRLVKPGCFEEVEINHTLNEKDVEVKPYLASVCHADLRYFTGNRRKEALESKLPMALFHEGLGIVGESLHPGFKEGDRVVIAPAIPGYILNNTNKDECCSNCKNGGHSNYCLDGKFLGSGYDGVGQSNLVISGDNLVLVPADMDDNIALLTELCSVSLFAMNSVDNLTSNSKVAVFGDGPVGYLTAATLRFAYQIPKENLLVFGAIPEKIAKFDRFATIALVDDFDFTKSYGIQTVFECTGGKFSSNAINQAIDLIDREGTLVLMGVTEDLVPINTRDILEKGVHLVGSSRSTVVEFSQLMKAFKSTEYQLVLQELVPKESNSIKSTEDLMKAMELATEQRGWKKAYLSFEWDYYKKNKK